MLTQRRHTAGNTRRFVADYRDWMNRGTTMASFTAVSDSAAITVSGVAVQGDDTGIFLISGGTVGLTFNITLTLTTSYGEIKKDTVPFLVVAP